MFSLDSWCGRTFRVAGRLGHGRLAVWSRAADVWMESGETLFSGHSVVFSGIWPGSGSMRNGEVFERLMSDTAIVGNGCSSLLGTPTASLTKGEGPVGSRSHRYRLERGYLDSQVAELFPSVRATSSTGACAHGEGSADLQTVAALLPTLRASDGVHGGSGRRESEGDSIVSSAVVAERFGRFSPAVARQEEVTGLVAPDPTEPGRNHRRLSARFCEWMMGLPAGWIVDVPGMSRREAIELAGNGVVPGQAAAAISSCLAGFDDDGRR